MDPDKDRRRRPSRDEYEVASTAKELGRPLQRRVLQRRFSEIGDTTSAAAHGDEAGGDDLAPMPRWDRAG